MQPAHPGARFRDQRRPPRKNKGGTLVLIISLLGVVLLAGVAFMFVPRMLESQKPAGPAAGTEVTVEIPVGASGDEIASILSKAHVIEDSKSYYAAVAALGADLSLKPGTYRFVVGQSPEEVVRLLVAGPNVEAGRLTVPEGMTVTQTADKVEAALGIPAQDFLDAAHASAFVGDYPFLSEAANDSLEGYLWPKTYTFTGTPQATDVIRAMLDQYAHEHDELGFDAGREEINRRYGVEMSEYDILKMASIIERETLTDDQRVDASSTFYNRLKIDMALQSDATMMYVTGGEVTAQDLKIESPYNTYLNKGLPPTPICTPSRASIAAALAPSDTDYLYFYYSNGTVYFSKTHDEHLEAIERNR
ncbi:endolytic transglycosylase MltG [Collinsella sp. AGMB00827]|uniref:Endolytic murein transglycosylase n=1 Tax=Collinsella ureilytica TaxID=2869515 RepID=A0ABS7MNX1_9ACTN|nr:endolytic transglycosylase MltG [Collinsella urealyticum]